MLFSEIYNSGGNQSEGEGDELKVSVRCSNVNNLDLKYLDIRRVNYS